MGLIIFLRHGQAQNNTARVLAGRAPGVSLTETGIKQADNIGRFLKSFDVSHIYTSPIERAQKTAEIVGNHIGLPTTIDERIF
jgi:probable phosphoglycerate mutase